VTGPPWPALAVFGVGIANLALFRYVWPWREEPGGTWFLVVIGVQVFWCGTYGVVINYADLIAAEQDPPTSDYAETIRRTSSELVDLGEKARDGRDGAGSRAGRKRVSRRTDRTAYGDRPSTEFWQREPGPRVFGHEESPPTVRAGDRAQARSGRPLALEQKRDPSPRPMRCATPRPSRAGKLTHRGLRAAPPRADG